MARGRWPACLGHAGQHAWSTHLANHVLVKAENVALRLCEPGSLLGAHDAHMVGGLEVRQVVVKEIYASAFQLPDLVGNVLDLKSEHCV